MDNPEWAEISSISSDDDLEDAHHFAANSRSDYSRLRHGQTQSVAALRSSTVCTHSHDDNSDYDWRTDGSQAIPLDVLAHTPDAYSPGRDIPQDYQRVSIEDRRPSKSDRSQTELRPRDVPKWRPFWFRSSTLWVFCGLFICLAVVLVFLVAYSQANNGLTDANDRLAHVWRFGPIACKIP